MKRVLFLGVAWAVLSCWAQSSLTFLQPQGFTLNRPLSLGQGRHGYVQTPESGGDKNGGVFSLSILAGNELRLFVNFDHGLIVSKDQIYACQSQPSDCIREISSAIEELSYVDPESDLIVTCMDETPNAPLVGDRIEHRVASPGATPFQKHVLESLFDVQHQIMIERCVCWSERKRTHGELGRPKKSCDD